VPMGWKAMEGRSSVAACGREEGDGGGVCGDGRAELGGGTCGPHFLLFSPSCKRNSHLDSF